MTLLAAEDVRVTLGGRRIVDGTSFVARAGECVGLVGPNGAGKSSLLKAAVGLVASQGSVRIDGAELSSLSPQARAEKVAYLSQDRDIGWALSVEAVVALGRAPRRPAFAAMSAKDRAAVEGAMTCMGVAAFRSRPATALSGGERARVLIARALAQETALLLADEPTAGLDPAHQIALMETFSGLARGGRSVVVCLHELGLAARWCDRVLLMSEGRIVADGPPTACLSAENLAEVYGVEAFVARDVTGPLVLPVGLTAAWRGRRA